MSIKQTTPLEGSKRSGFVRLVGIILTIAMLIGVISSVGLIMGIAATTETFTDENGISWTVTESYPGWGIAPSDKSQIVGEVTVPSVYNGKVVNSIAPSAFKDCSNAFVLNIPSIEHIGEYAFNNATGLSSIKRMNSLTSLGDSAFYGSGIKSITIPNKVKHIGFCAFARSSLESVDVYSSSVGDGMFADCRNLENVRLTDNVVKIGYDAFSGCDSLVSIVIPDSVTEIDERGMGLFYHCDSLKNVIFSSSLTKIPDSCFSYCAGIEDVYIPDNIKVLGNACFMYCPSLKHIRGCQNVEEIGSRFIYGSTPRNIYFNLPESLRIIGDSALCACIFNNTVNLPNLEYLANGAFYNTRFDSISINPDISFIGAQNNIYIISENNRYVQLAQKGEDIKQTKTAQFEQNGVKWTVRNFGEGWWISPTPDTSVTSLPETIIVPDNYNGEPVVAVQGFNTGAFSSQLKKVVLPSSIKTIGSMAFMQSSLEEIVIPDDSVELISQYAFQSCRKLTSITLPSSLKRIDEEAFIYTGRAVTSLPNNLEYIGRRAFYEGSNIEIIPDSVTYIGKEAFAGTYGAGNYIPEGTLVIPENTIVSYHAFENLYAKNLVIKSSALSNIDSSAFYNATIWGNTTLDTSVNKIDTSLLSGNLNFSELNVSDGFDVTNPYAFYGDENLTVYTPVKAVTTGVRQATTFANVPLVVIDGIIESGGYKDAIVTLDTETPNLRVTVPSVLPISVDSDNNVTVADNAQINNMCRGQVDITSADLNTSTWSLVDFNTDFKTVSVDTKQYGFKLYNDDASDGIDTNIFSTINGGDSLMLSYDGNVAIQSEAKTAEEIGNIVFTVAWHKG